VNILFLSLTNLERKHFYFTVILIMWQVLILWFYMLEWLSGMGHTERQVKHFKNDSSYPAPKIFKIFILFIILNGVRLSPLGTAATTDLLYQSQMIDDGDCGAIGGMKIGRRNRTTRRESAPAPLCPPQIPHDQARARTRATSMGSHRLTAWAMAWPFILFVFFITIQIPLFFHVEGTKNI
jgi:hypothetical protein